MIGRARLAGLLDRQVSLVLRRWEGYKLRHPETAQRMAPVLRGLWRMAVRRRSHLAGLRPIPLIGAGPSEIAALMAADKVDARHTVVEPDARIGARVEYVFLVPDRGVLLVGWLCDPRGHLTSVRVRTRTSVSDDIRARMSRFPRSDVIETFRSWLGGGSQRKPGFTCFVEIPDVSSEEVTGSLSIELATKGRSWTLEPRPMVGADGDEPLAAIRSLLTVVPPGDATILNEHVGPAIAGMWRTKEDEAQVIEVGRPPSRARVSVVVPVYGRYDLIEYQMALFANDPDIRGAELIYVIDDPRITQDVVTLCRSIEPIFKVPCRLVLCTSNHGYARATNLGAGVAHGELLLLMNSDVIPRAPGWLSALADAYSELPEPGALGPRLLYPDGSLQHAGMSFVQAPWLPGLWLNDHPGKGLPASRVVAREPVRVPAITGACLMISRQLYEGVGGLDEGYVVGDFEDSDLCLKLLERGHHSWVAPWIELYHVERMSVALTGDPGWRQSITLYNAWRHTRRWGHLLPKLESGAVDA